MSTYKQKFNKKYGFAKDQSHSIAEIAKLTGYNKTGLETIKSKGEGAYYSNPQSVRPQVKSAEQWGYARVYSAVNPQSKAHIKDKAHLKK